MADQVNQDELVQQFSAISGEDPERARFFLEAAAWNVANALSSFYEESQEVIEVPAAQGASETGTAATAAATAGIFGEESSDDEEQQPYYAGGSQTSGQQVLGPNKKKDLVSKIFKAAKQQGAEVLEESSSSSGSKPMKATFKGTSYKLGETSSDSQVIPDAHSRSSDDAPQAVELRLYREGFTVGDGPIRGYQEEENQRFIADIKRGRIPLELIRASGGREVSINMADMRHEKYEAPKRKLQAFSGSGQALGSPAPAVVGQVPHVAGPGGSATKPPPAAADPTVQEQLAKTQINVDASQPTTNVQIRLSDGSRLVVRANHTHTVANLRSYLNTARPEYTQRSIALMTTFPHAELALPDQTLAAANILNAAIVVKPK